VAAVDTGALGTSITVTAETPGQWFAIEVVEDGVAAGHAGLLVENLTPDAGIAADAAAIKNVDDTWYGIMSTSQGKAELDALAAWVESNGKLMVQASQDGTILDGTAGNVMLLSQTAARRRTGFIYHQNPAQFAGLAWMSNVFPIDPGGVTFTFRRLANVDKSPLSTTQMTNIENANGSYFVDIGGVGMTYGKDGGGKVASGEWLDIIRDTDWYEVQIGVEILKVMLGNNKVPMTNDGIAMVEAGLRARDHARRGFRLPGPGQHRLHHPRHQRDFGQQPGAPHPRQAEGPRPRPGRHQHHQRGRHHHRVT
jgi:hypothetical protein